MQPILVVYGTTEGHARDVATFIAERLRGHGKVVDLVDSATPEAAQAQPIYSGVVIGGSVHHQRHQTALAHFVKQNLDWLNVVPTAFFSVNLAMLEPGAQGRAEAQRAVDAFIEETGLKPAATRLVAGALKYTQYDYFKRALLRYFVKPGGLDAATVGDVAYTDWEDVGRFVDDWLAATQGEGR